MSYDPSHRKPPRQERSPHATPPTGWPPYRDDDDRDGEHADSRHAADRQDAYPATAGHRRQGASGGPGDRGYRSAVATDTFPPAANGYGSPAGYGPAGGYGDARDGYDWTANGHRVNGYGAGNGNRRGYGAGSGGSYGGAGNGSSYGTGGYAGGINGYAGAAGDFIEAANGYAGTVGGYPSAAGDRDAIWSPRGGATAERQRLGPVIGTRDQRAARRRAWRRIQSLPFRQSIARVSGLGSKATMTRLLAAEAFLGERHRAAADTAVPVRARELGGNVVWLRPRSTDRLALEFVDYGYHLPPAALTGPVRHIAVFGANIGLLMADLAGRYPQARLLGVEPDHDNALLAQRNLAHLGGRCTLEEAAVWYRDETLTLTWEPDAWGQIVTGPAPGNGSAATVRHIDAVDAANLLAAFTGPAPVDYLLVNIESAWYEMLRHGRWTENVRCITIEIQDHYDEAVPLLETLGYQAQLHRLNWGAFATGIRPR